MEQSSWEFQVKQSAFPSVGHLSKWANGKQQKHQLKGLQYLAGVTEEVLMK